ncbi:MAG: MOSC domain-containing protein [Deltaproteobacteria bacterium]|nr:MOSC domain-containing protein [Deltaproteobacteria bacterium]
MASIQAVCTSSKKGVVKKERERVVLKENWGIDGDAHAGKWHRQVSMLAGESIEKVRKILPSLKNGAFAENIITEGIDLNTFKKGDRLHLGEKVVLEVTQIGKQCHNDGCAIKKATGDCIMPKEGIFTKVLHGGTLRKGDPVTRLLTVSDSNS